MGEQYSLADVVWTVIVARMRFMRFPLPQPVADWYARMKARPSFDRADVWERPKPGVMLPLLGQVLRMRLGL